MGKRFSSEQEMNEFLTEPRLAILMYNRPDSAPLGVPVWFDWDGETLRMFAGRTSPKVKQIKQNPNISVLVTNRVGEPEGWVAFDGEATVTDFEPQDWLSLIDRVAPRYWDLSDPGYAGEIENWRAAPDAFVLLEIKRPVIRSGA